MWLPPIVATPASSAPVTVADAKAHLFVDHSVDDTLIGAYVTAATAHVERMTGTFLVDQGVTLRTDAWADMERLPAAPLSAIASITYVDTSGELQTLAGTVYEARLYGLRPAVVLKYGQTWPQTQPGSLITVNATAGYGDAGEQPADLLHAIKMLVADMYMHRESTAAQSAAVPTPAGVTALLSNHRIYG